MPTFVGEKIRRSVLDSEGFEIGYSIGKIVAWIPAERGVLSGKTGQPVELWQAKPIEYCLYEVAGSNEYAVRHPPISLGGEELELDEMQEAIQDYSEAHFERTWCKARKNQTIAKIAASLQVEPDQLLQCGRRQPRQAWTRRFRKGQWLEVVSESAAESGQKRRRKAGGGAGAPPSSPGSAAPAPAGRAGPLTHPQVCSLYRRATKGVVTLVKDLLGCGAPDPDGPPGAATRAEAAALLGAVLLGRQARGWELAAGRFGLERKRAERLRQCREVWSGMMEATAPACGTWLRAPDMALILTEAAYSAEEHHRVGGLLPTEGQPCIIAVPGFRDCDGLPVERARVLGSGHGWWAEA